MGISIQNPRRLLQFGSSTTRMLCTRTDPTQAPAPTRSPDWIYSSKEFSYLYRRISARRKNIERVTQIRNERFNQALETQLLEWAEKRGMHPSYRDHSIRMDLLWKTQGLAAAEKYFTELPKPAINKFTYGVLLKCYCSEKEKEKAMTLLQQMREQTYPLDSFNYNSLMCLHMKLGEPEKVLSVAQEMKKKNIALNLFTYNLLITSYGSLNDIEGAEKAMEEMKMGSVINPDWTVYANLASVYVSAGLFEKAGSTLQELEKKEKLRDRKAFHFLLTLYASIGNVTEVKRVWNSLKSAFPNMVNSSYLTMLRTLVRWDDFEGVKKCFEEWESCFSSFDIRLFNVAIGAYLKQDMVEEAKLLFQRAVKKGAKPNFATFMIFVNFYVKTCQMDLALKYMEAAIPEMKNPPSDLFQEKAHLLLKYFEEVEDVNGVKELYRILKQANCLDQKVIEAYNSQCQHIRPN